MDYTRFLQVFLHSRPKQDVGTRHNSKFNSAKISQMFENAPI